jgi:hypothetical protein
MEEVEAVEHSLEGRCLNKKMTEVGRSVSCSFDVALAELDDCVGDLDYRNNAGRGADGLHCECLTGRATRQKPAQTRRGQQGPCDFLMGSNAVCLDGAVH